MTLKTTVHLGRRGQLQLKELVAGEVYMALHIEDPDDDLPLAVMAVGRTGSVSVVTLVNYGSINIGDFLDRPHSYTYQLVRSASLEITP